MENPAENAQDTATDDLLLADPPDDDESILEEPAPARQGLPPGFRMRHDRHYVEELMGMRVTPAPRPVPHVAETAPPAPAPAAPREKSDAAARVLRAALIAVAERLDVVSQHANAGRRSMPMTSFERAQQIELDRASRLAHAAVAIAGDLQLARREVTAGEISDRAIRDIAGLRRFSGIRYRTSVDDATFRISVDPVAATRAVAATLDAFSDLLGTSRDPEDDDQMVRLRVHAVQPRPALMIEISAAGVALSEDAMETFFEPTAGCHPAGAEAALLLSAAARIARAHGGRADARRGDNGEVVALLVFPK